MIQWVEIWRIDGLLTQNFPKWVYCAENSLFHSPLFLIVRKAVAAGAGDFRTKAARRLVHEVTYGDVVRNI